MLLAATAAGLVLADASQAQEAGGLRGGLAVDDSGRALLAGEDETPAGSAYVPVSPGALPEEPATVSQDVFERDEAEAQAPTATEPEETDDIATATVREPTIDSAEDQPLDPGAERVPAIEGLNRPVEENPYDAVGIRWGAFILKPTLETGVTATSNADSSADGSEAVLSETTLRLNAASDWTSHSATVDAYGTFRKT